MKKVWSIDTTEYYSVIKRHKIVPFVEAWMNLECVIQNEVRRERQVSYINAYIWNLEKMIQMTLITMQKYRHRYREQIYGYQGGKRGMG